MALVGVAHALEIRDDDPDYPALLMLNYILGGSADSRLFNRLRQKEGLSYGAFSGLSAFPIDKNGYFFAGAICAPENADKAMKSLMEELEKLIKEGAEAKEIAEAKKSYALNWDGQIAEDEFVAQELTQQLFLGRTFAYWKAVNGAIQKLTPADVTAAARKYIQLARLTKVKAGDYKQ
jgi:zinc protease